MVPLADEPRLRGSSALVEAPDSPKLEKPGFDLVRVSRKFTGPWAVCVAAAPDPGDAMLDYSDLTVRQPVRVTHTEGGHAILEYSGSNEPIGEPINTGSEEAAHVFEIEWTQVVKPLESHPRYTAGGDMELTDDDLNKLHEWRAETNAAKRAALRGALSSHAEDFAKKIDKGLESYVVYAPIGRVTSNSASAPATGGCGFRQSPPSEVQVSGYEYLKTADRLQSTGRWWQRVQEWTGVDEWDHDIYAAFSSARRKLSPRSRPKPKRKPKKKLKRK